MKHLAQLVIAFMLVSIASSERTFAAKKVKETMVMAFFRDNGQAGVYMASSDDGLNFTPLNNDQPVMKPAPWEGQNLTRDPSVVYHDGLFHMVWTTSWKGNCFAYARSKDLVNWSEPVRVEPFPADIKPGNTWAPEICWDPYQKNFMIFWSSVVNPKRKQQIFVTRTTDGITFSEAHLFLDRNYSCIDGMVALDKKNKRWLIIYKNEEKEENGGKNLRVATSPLDFSKPWEDLGKPVVGPGTSINSESMVEGPSLLRAKKGWDLYWDSPLIKSYGMAISSGLKDWESRSSELNLPKNLRHGTVFKAPASAIGWLKKADYLTAP